MRRSRRPRNASSPQPRQRTTTRRRGNVQGLRTSSKWPTATASTSTYGSIDRCCTSDTYPNRSAAPSARVYQRKSDGLRNHAHRAHSFEVVWSGNQDVVEAFPAERADEAFRDRVRPRCPGRGADDPYVGTGEDCVERGGELAVPVADQEPEPVGAVAEIHEQVASLLGHPDTGGV